MELASTLSERASGKRHLAGLTMAAVFLIRGFARPHGPSIRLLMVIEPLAFLVMPVDCFVESQCRNLNTISEL